MNRKPGDWNCRSCQHLNFSRRDSCQRCSDSRPLGIGGSSGGGGGGWMINSNSNEYYGTGFGSGREGSSLGFSSGPDVRPGDWYCSCGTHNFASRSGCFKCNAFRDDSVAAAAGFNGADVARHGLEFAGIGVGRAAGWKPGDWICSRSGCNQHNFASRIECFRCNAPRDSGTEF